MFVYRANRDVDREFPTYLILQDTSKRVYETPDGSDSVDELAEPLTPQHVKDLAEYKQLSTIALRHSGDISHGTHIWNSPERTWLLRAIWKTIKI